VLFDTGGHEDALHLAEQFEVTSDMVDLVEVRVVQTRIYTLRGQAEQTIGWLDSLVTTASDTAEPEMVVMSLAAAAHAHTALASPNTTAAALLGEVDTTPGTRNNPYYTVCLPGMVRTALTINDPDLVEQLLTGVEPRHPYTQHALVAAGAAIAEHLGDHATVATGFADAATRWESFGVVPEHAFALLGQGRCLIAAGNPTEATPVLRQARALFSQLHAAPPLAETETLLGQPPPSPRN
jgi:hypothetical protein